MIQDFEYTLQVTFQMHEYISFYVFFLDKSQIILYKYLMTFRINS